MTTPSTRIWLFEGGSGTSRLRSPIRDARTARSAGERFPDDGGPTGAHNFGHRAWAKAGERANATDPTIGELTLHQLHSSPTDTAAPAATPTTSAAPLSETTGGLYFPRASRDLLVASSAVTVK